jgi:hypothetical protein
LGRRRWNRRRPGLENKRHKESVSIKTHKRFYLVFLLSVEALLEADSNEI